MEAQWRSVIHINKHLNHLSSISRQLCLHPSTSAFSLSSDKQTFEDAAPAYQNALGHNNFSHKLEYTPHETQRPRRNRQRNVIWFNPLFSKNVKTNIARSFLHLVDTHFPVGHKLHKIFNRNTVKVSYSCVDNVRSIITNHNTRVTRRNHTQVISADNWKCRNKEECPLQNKCMKKDIVYKATISTSNDTKYYIGMTSNTFKVHMTSSPFFFQKFAVTRRFEWYMSCLKWIKTSKDIWLQTRQKLGFLKSWPGEKRLGRISSLTS